MYAVIKTGGKQHKVQPGDILEVEYLHGAEDRITFHPLLVVDDEGKTHVGKEVERAVVTAKLLGERKGEKVRIFKYKNKTGYARRAGHRQLLTLVQIEDVSLGETPRRRATAKAKTGGQTEAAAPEAAIEAEPSETAAGSTSAG